LFHFACIVIVIRAGGCATLPDNSQRSQSFHLTDTSETRLAKTFSPAVADHPGQSGLHPVLSGIDAFAARIILADLAQRSLDVQYYIWDPDDTGMLLAEHLIAAADRGVRVRILLDDFGATASDKELLALDGHPNIEVRLFNPIALRSNKYFGALLDFARSTRRMHNKSFNADNQVAIIGGRNIGDEYFEASSRRDMADLDAVVIGRVVPELSESFDLFWNSPGSFPIESLTGHPKSADEAAAVRAQLLTHAEQMQQSSVGRAYGTSPLRSWIEGGELPFFWGNAVLYHDDPRKAAEQSNDPEHRKFPALKATIDGVHNELLVISPYFVPGRAGMDFIRQLRERGLRIRILTNSMGSSDVLKVYAFYSRYRKELLAMGVELYELRPDVVHRPHEADWDAIDSTVRASLHAKVLAFDREAMYVGSTNLDPRSENLNTEVGVIFDSNDMSSDICHRLDERLLQIAWRVEAVPVDTLFGKDIRLNWVTQEQESTVRLTEEPGQTFWKNLTVALLRMLPIEDQL
jgi:putative cardiolipin synthase